MAQKDCVNLDEILSSLKPWGLWQSRQIAFLLLLAFPASFQMISFILIGTYPDYGCDIGPYGLDVNVTESQITGVRVDRRNTHNGSRYTFSMRLENTSHWTDRNESTIVRKGTCQLWNTSSQSAMPCIHGYAYGKPKDISIISEWDLVCSRQYIAELSQTMYTLGQCIGTVASMYLADRYGRKWVCLLNVWICWAVGTATAFSPSPLAFNLLRFATGAFQAGFIMAVDVILVEILPVAERTHLAFWGNIAWALAVTSCSGMGYLCRNLSWRYTQVVMTAPCILVVVNMIYVDESLRWLLANGKYDAMKRIIGKAARVNDRQDHPTVQESLIDTGEMTRTRNNEPDSVVGTFQVNRDQSPVNSTDNVSECYSEVQPKSNTTQYSPLELFRHPRLRRFSVILLTVWVVNGWVYLGLLLTSSALAGNMYLNLFLNTVVELPGGLLTYCCLRWIGRRYTCVIFNGLAAVGLLVSSILQLTSDQDGSSVITAFSIVGKFGNVVCFGAMFTYTPELFPTNLRSLGLGLAGSAGRIGMMVAPYSMIMIQVRPWLPGVVYSAGSLLCALILLNLPETRDKPLPQTIEDIEAWFSPTSKTDDKSHQ